MYEKCAQLLGNTFNATYAVYLLLAHKCKSPGGVIDCIKNILGMCGPNQILY